jgi:electron transfer flavoprotein alpha subunit
MDFVVLVKVVPAADELQFDPERLTVVRDAIPLFLNPFDQRALRVALELRRPGERVTVLSMGPPAARGPLREALVHGADEAILITDPVLVGSDSLATARVLAAAAGQVPHEVVVAGAWTTDSETGQVPPEVAVLLGMPVLTGARTISRDPAGPGLEITIDTATGWAAFHAVPPLVVSVGEKIAKPLRVAPEAFLGVPEASVHIVSAHELAIAPDRVGLAGSPTWVDSVTVDAPSRRPRLFAEGGLVDRVDGAWEALRPLLEAPSLAPEALPPPPIPLRDDREVIVLASGPDGDLEPSALGSISEVRRAWPGCWPSAIWVGPPPAESDTYRLDLAGALGGYLVPRSGVPFDSRATALAVGSVLDRRTRAAAVLLSSDPFGREIAGQLAARRALGLVGDAVGLGQDDRGFVFTKPSFGGRTIARIRTRTSPALATVRPGAFVGATDSAAGGGFGWTVLPAVTIEDAFAFLSEGRELPEGGGLDGQDLVVAVGLGIGGPEGVARLRPTLVRWGAGFGATRKVVDAGWVPRQLQIGLTGKALAPRLAVLLGVGGSANHLIGWRRARAILAVNRDPAAPVFRDVDVGIVGEIDEVLPLLEGPIARWFARPRASPAPPPLRPP